jgi:Protein of unknown function VcgC/VcgE (DUF2780)
MEEFTKFVTERLGVSESVVRQAVKVLLEFAQKKLPAAEFEQLISHLPGAVELLAEPSKGEATGGLGGMLGGFLSGDLADAAKAYSRLQAAGLSTAQIGPFLQVFVTKAREVAGPEVVDSFLSKIPALQTFLKSGV